MDSIPSDYQKRNGRPGYPAMPVAEIITNGFFTVDRQWTVKHWNKEAETLLGVKGKDIVGKNLWEEFAGVIPLKFYSVYHKAFLQDIPFHFEEYWDEMGAWFDVMTYHFGETLSVSFKNSDHTLRKELHPEQQLRKLNELYRYVTEVTNDCLWEWDLVAKKIFWIDGGHERVFGYPIVNATIPQIFWENRVHPDDKERLLTRLNEVITSEVDVGWQVEYRFKRADGRYAYVHDRAHIIYDDGKGASRMIGATQDITARKLSEMQLLEKERELAHERLTRQKKINDAVLTALENERADIGKELHDNLNQILGAAKLYVELAKTAEEHKEMYLETSSAYLVTVMDAIRGIYKTLTRPIE
jgi:PAS domain S-box-containing protein